MCVPQFFPLIPWHSTVIYWMFCTFSQLLLLSIEITKYRCYRLRGLYLPIELACICSVIFASAEKRNKEREILRLFICWVIFKRWIFVWLEWQCGRYIRHRTQMDIHPLDIILQTNNFWYIHTHPRIIIIVIAVKNCYRR